MGQRAVVYSIMPESPEVDLGKLKDSIVKAVPQGLQLRGTAEKPVAFGLTALHVMVVLEDKTGGTEKFEESLNKIPGIQNVEVVEDTLL